MNSRFLSALVLVFILFACGLSGQETRRMIYGRVADPQGSAVSNAVVTVTNTGTNTSVQLKTNETGYYEANLLLPGDYQVQVDAAGFRRSLRGGIVLPVSSRLERWFNTTGFERTAVKGPAAFHRRVFPTRIDNLRADMTNQWNVNLQREFRIRERATLQVRFDAINLQNPSQFDPPNVNPFSTDFGRIMQQSAALNRLLQVHGRVRF